MKQYKTIFFDWDNTLSNSLFWEQLADPSHPRHSQHNNIINFLFTKNKSLVRDWMRGKLDKEYIASLISKEFGYSKNSIIDDLKISCKNMHFIDNSILKLINKIRRKGINCVIATDNMDTFMEYTKPALKLDNYFDDFLVSFNEKCLKFDTKDNSIPFFERYLNKKKLAYEDVILFDDCNDNSGTYKKLGFTILQISTFADLLKNLEKLAN
jgi:FMN phosphatase YigB (HAD superfamily)